jgi:dTMP kinase
MKQKRYTGRLIVIEGTDGAGTTTQMMALGKSLQQRFIKEGGFRSAVCTREPFLNDLGRHTKSILSQMEAGKVYPQSLYDEIALSFATNRLQHYNNFVRPHLDAGNVVISDRFTLSSMVYQGMNCDRAWLEQINSHAAVPDLLIFLRCSEEVCAARLRSRGLPQEFYESDDRRARVIERYEEEFSAYPHHAIAIDGELQPLAVMDQYLPTVNAIIA